MITILTGILLTHVSEAVTWLNKKFTGTVLEGLGAFTVALVISFAAATFEVVRNDGFQVSNWDELLVTFSTIFSASQIWFMYVVKKFHLDVEGGVGK